MKTTEKFLLKPTVLAKLRTMSEKYESADKFTSSKEFKEWLKHPQPPLNKHTERAYMTEIIAGIYDGMSDDEIIESVRLLRRAEMNPTPSTETEEDVSIEGLDPVAREMLILMDDELKSDVSEEDTPEDVVDVEESATDDASEPIVLVSSRTVIEGVNQESTSEVSTESQTPDVSSNESTHMHMVEDSTTVQVSNNKPVVKSYPTSVTKPIDRPFKYDSTPVDLDAMYEKARKSNSASDRMAWLSATCRARWI